MTEPPSPPVQPGRAAPGLGPRLWSRFCRTLVRVFYRRVEVGGTEHLPRTGGVLLCANHASALADAVILQAACPLPFHPLARSGLFENALLRPLLAMLQAVPIYRRQDAGSDTAKNDASFTRCFELLAAGEALLIFPEGQSHSDPSLRQLKTGAARLALGALHTNGVPPTVIPVGITFTRKGKFRSRVLIQFGPAVAMPHDPAAVGEEEVRATTDAIHAGLSGVTLNLDSWEDFDFLVALRRFFAFRRGRREHRGSLAHRLRALQRLSEAQRVLRRRAPARVAALTRKLRRFQRVCERFGVRDYHLKVRYSGRVVARFVARSLLFIAIVFPLALWGVLNSALPFFLTRHLARRLARGSDQYDTTKMLLGMLLFGIFWSAEAYIAWRFLSLRWAVWYAASLPATAAIAVAVGRERARILDNLRAFVLFARNHDLRPYLLAKREEIEGDLARLARLAKQPEVRVEAERDGLVTPAS